MERSATDLVVEKANQNIPIPSGLPQNVRHHTPTTTPAWFIRILNRQSTISSAFRDRR